MIEPGEVTQGECSLITRIEPVERGSEQGELVGVVDPVEIVDGDVVTEPVHGAPGTVAAAPALATMVIGELVRRDTEKPWRDATRPPPETIEAAERTLEGGRRDVLGQLSIATPAIHEAMNRVDMKAVELGERNDVGTRPFDERSLVEQTRILGAVIHQPPA